MIKRWQEQSLKTVLNERRGVHLTGARQTGKTTLSRFVAGNGVRFLTLDDEKYLSAAKSDPLSFVERGNASTFVIDEIQKVPELLNAIKMKIDRDNTPGQYLITGSSNLRFVKAVKDSLAGRLGRVKLRTLSLGEILGGKGHFLDMAFQRDFSSCPIKLDKREIIHCAFCGGYPEPLNFSVRSRKSWYAEYIDDLLTKDIQDVTEIRKVDALKKTAYWLMAYSSKLFELKDLCAVSQLGKETLGSYITALKTLYVIDEVPAWSKSDYVKIGKRSKYFAGDSGLVANLLGWDENQVYYDADDCGKLIESWVCHQLSVLAELDIGYEISHYRDSDKREIDFIVEAENGELLGIEVKSGTVYPDDFKHLKWFSKNLAKTRFTGIVLYSGNDVLSFGDGFYAVPLALLGV